MKTLALLAVFLALPALAADADFYQRTGTKPPIAGDFVLGPSLHYAQQISPGIAFGYTWKQTGITLLGDASLLRLGAQDGSAPYNVGNCVRYADWTTGAHTQAQIGVMVLVPLKSYAKAAK
jgi:hypothetical protein